jgi:hypothetical protein
VTSSNAVALFLLNCLAFMVGFSSYILHFRGTGILIIFIARLGIALCSEPHFDIFKGTQD